MQSAANGSATPASCPRSNHNPLVYHASDILVTHTAAVEVWIYSSHRTAHSSSGDVEVDGLIARSRSHDRGVEARRSCVSDASYRSIPRHVQIRPTGMVQTQATAWWVVVKQRSPARSEGLSRIWKEVARRERWDGGFAIHLLDDWAEVLVEVAPQ
jgi:hypothetical protein